MNGLKGLSWAGRHSMKRRGIQLESGQPLRQPAAFSTAEIRQLLSDCQHDLGGLRDQAMILFGFAGALRRSDLVAIESEHLTFVADTTRGMVSGTGST
jgi:integrase